jgi:LEA14-like dessication related protein
MSQHRNILPWLVGAAVVGGGIYLYKGGKLPALVNPFAHLAQTFKNLQIKIGGVHLEEKHVVITMKVLNPNSDVLEIRSIVGSMLANGHKIADIKMFGDYVVQGNSEQPIEVIANPVNVNLYTELVRMLKTGHTRVSYQGVINVNNTPVTVNLGYTA